MIMIQHCGSCHSLIYVLMNLCVDDCLLTIHDQLQPEWSPVCHASWSVHFFRVIDQYLVLLAGISQVRRACMEVRIMTILRL